MSRMVRMTAVFSPGGAPRKHAVLAMSDPSGMVLRGDRMLTNHPAGKPVSADDHARPEDSPRGIWPIRSGLLPPLAAGFVGRPESAPGLGQVLKPGTAVALIPARSARAAVQPGSPDWAGSVGKTQLAVYFAETLWQAGEIELLLWVNAASRVSILSAYAA